MIGHAFSHDIVKVCQRIRCPGIFRDRIIIQIHIPGFIITHDIFQNCSKFSGSFVNFRFRGGGARADRRELRAKFLAETLRRSRFAVDRRGDLVTAWFRRYPRARCEEALDVLGKLMACSRQLDMLIANTRIAHEYAERFLAGEYEIFR